MKAPLYLYLWYQRSTWLIKLILFYPVLFCFHVCLCVRYFSFFCLWKICGSKWFCLWSLFFPSVSSLFLSSCSFPIPLPPPLPSWLGISVQPWAVIWIPTGVCSIRSVFEAIPHPTPFHTSWKPLSSYLTLLQSHRGLDVVTNLDSLI